MAHDTAGQLPGVVPAGQVAGGLHVHVAQPPSSATSPFAHVEGSQRSAGHLQVGGCHAHLPSVFRAQPPPTIVPVGQYGAANGGGGPQSSVVHAGGGLHSQVGQPLASSTLPYWQKM
ncbi:MAG TPA: hypothetical protein VG818_02235, partial [Gemmatimonadaceae bacterium]|nr:hypothetical protein [Gemmatimonadaceae bacterium]